MDSKYQLTSFTCHDCLEGDIIGARTWGNGEIEWAFVLELKEMPFRLQKKHLIEVWSTRFDYGKNI